MATFLEEQIEKLKAEGKYHPEQISVGFSAVKVSNDSDRPALGTEYGSGAATFHKVVSDLPVEMPPVYAKLWGKLLEHTSDHPVTKTDLVPFLFPVSYKNDIEQEDDDNAGGRNSKYRKIRDMIEELREVYGKLAGSRGSYKNIRGGYFACHTERDYQVARTYRLQKMLAEKAAVDGLDRNWAAAQSKDWQKPEQETLIEV